MRLVEIYVSAGLTPGEIEKMSEYLDWNDGFYGSSAFDKLYEYFAFETGEMPYSVAKARTQTPDEWILEQLS